MHRRQGTQARNAIGDSATLPRTAIVVGAGLAGVSTAYILARSGVKVSVFEAREHVGLETSFANGGLLTPSMPDPWNGPGVAGHLLRSLFSPSASMKLRPSAVPSLLTWGLLFLANSRRTSFEKATEANFHLCHFSTRVTAAWCKDEGLQDLVATSETLKVFRSSEAMAAPLAIATALAPHGLEFKKLNVEQTVMAEPTLEPIADQIVGSIAYPDDMKGDAHQFTQALAARAEALGAEFQFGCPVDRIIKENGQAIGVSTKAGNAEADLVIICAANASRTLLDPLGIRLPIRPAKGYSLTLNDVSPAHMPKKAVVDDAMHTAVVPLQGRLRIVGTAEFAGNDQSLDLSRIKNLRRLLSEIYPTVYAASDLESGEPWTGLRPMSADGKPFIGPTHIPGLWVNTGHGHLGWTMAAGSARLCLDLLTGEASDIDPEAFSVFR